MAVPEFHDSDELSNLRGKVALVTGATSGLGYATARGLLCRGATVYLTAMTEGEAIVTIERLEAEGLAPGNGTPRWHLLDLSNPHGVKKSAEDFLTRESRLDILVNNAACLGKEYAIGPTGVQEIVTINYISPFLFTRLLLPLLKKTAQNPDNDVRIVNVGSDGHRNVDKAQFKSKEDLNGPTTSNAYYAQFKRYCLSKLLVVIWTKELARRIAASREDGGSDILVLSLHPGPIASEGAIAGAGRMFWPLSTIVRLVIKWTFPTPTRAATTALIAAAHPDLRKEKEKYHGAYLVPFGNLGTTSEIASDEVLAKDLWDLTEKVLDDENLQK